MPVDATTENGGAVAAKKKDDSSDDKFESEDSLDEVNVFFGFGCVRFLKHLM